MKLYSGPVSVFGAKTEIAALEKGLDLEIEHVPFTFENFYDPKPDKTLAINPKGEVPYLEDGDFTLFDSTLICEFFEEIEPSPALWPEDIQRRAQARLWELQADEIYFGDIRMLMPARRKEQTREEIKHVKARISAFQSKLDQQLVGRHYIADEYSYADIAFFCSSFFASFLGHRPIEELQYFDAWRLRMRERKPVQTVLGKMSDLLNLNGINATL